MQERQYLFLLQKLLTRGSKRSDRTGTGTRGLFGEQLRFGLGNGTIPLLTTKRVYWKSVVAELLWMLSGETNVKPLQEQGVTIWDEWAKEGGELGPVYGAQWRSWPGKPRLEESNGGDTGYVAWLDQDPIDQIARLQEALINDPYSRRHVVSAWNVADLPDMALAPCHCLFQFFVAEGQLSCHLYQRSADVFLGVPFNIASYGLLTRMMAAVVGLEAGDLIVSFGDVHLYENHVEQAKEQLKRDPRPFPTLRFNRVPQHVWEFQAEDIVLEDYNPHPPISAPVAV